jgi:integrase
MQSRKAKPARPYLRPARKDRRAVYVILDRGKEISTGCGEDEAEGAEAFYQEYIGRKHETTIGKRDLSSISISDVLIFYAELKKPQNLNLETPEGRRRKFRYGDMLDHLENVNEFWGQKTLVDVNGKNCREFVAWRTSQRLKKAKSGTEAAKRFISSTTASRELELLRAAINAYHAEYVLPSVPTVSLPDKAPAREAWLTRHQVARLLAASMGFIWDEQQNTYAFELTGNRRVLKRRDKVTRTRRAHVRRFILAYLYAGIRHEAIQLMQWLPNTTGGWWELDKERFYRKGIREAETKKRRPPGRIPRRLMPHLRRWAQIDAKPLTPYRDDPTHFFIHKPSGAPMSGPLRTAFEGICADAGLGADVTPHILRHTGITWAMQAGTDPEQVCQHYGVTLEVLQSTYWHHHPDFQEGMAGAFMGRRSKS